MYIDSLFLSFFFFFLKKKNKLGFFRLREVLHDFLAFLNVWLHDIQFNGQIDILILRIWQETYIANGKKKVFFFVFFLGGKEKIGEIDVVTCLRGFL